MIKIATCPRCGSVYRIEGTPTVEYTPAPRGVTCIICGASLPVPYGTWVIESTLARGKIPEEKPPLALFPILMFLAAIAILRWIARK